MYLNDRQKKRIDIVTYPNCDTTYLLGAFTVNNLANKDLIRKSGADTLRINVFKETKEEVKDIIQRARYLILNKPQNRFFHILRLEYSRTCDKDIRTCSLNLVAVIYCYPAINLNICF